MDGRPVDRTPVLVAHHVLIEGQPAPGTAVVLDDAASHHLLRVRRHPRDVPLTVADGEGNEAPAILAAVSQGRATLAITGPWVARPPLAARHLVWAIPKGPALDHGLRMAVEAGVTAIHLALGARSVARSDRGERWRRIVDGACEQCGRTDRPRLDPLWPDLGSALEQVPPGAARYVAAPGARSEGPTGEARALAIGPEGGFAPGELDALLDADWVPVGLGPCVLRSDTAVAVGVAWLSRD